MMYMRIAVGLHGPGDPKRIQDTYDALSRGELSHASPTMFNAGTPTPDLASCYLPHLPGDGDSIDSIYTLLKSTALISKGGGGVGFNVTTIRGTGTLIKGNGGRSNGIVPVLKCFETTAQYVDQGNKRPAAFAVYIEPWHVDIMDFLQLRLKTGAAARRTHDLNTALWIPDIFMRRAQTDGHWTLMCPHECPGLAESHGDDFEKLYLQYEAEGRGKKLEGGARKVFDALVLSLGESGEPYCMFKDTVNRCNNQCKETIQHSNLCVTGDTQLLTSEGPRAIGSLVPGSNVQSVEQSARANYEQRISALEKQLPKVVEEEDAAAQGTLKKIDDLKQMVAELPPPEEEVTKSTEVSVFNGETWSKVVPKCTGKKKELIRITTSHGTILDCTPQHQWINAAGDRVAAEKLCIGDKLQYTRPVVYEPSTPYNITESDAFTLGAVYGYALSEKGRSFTNQSNLTIKATNLIFRRETLSEYAIKMLCYDKAKVSEQFKDVDHENLVVITVPVKLSYMRVLPNASVDKRQAWCAGFAASVDMAFFSARTCHRVLFPVLMMFRSVGQHLKMVPAGRDETWFIAAVNLEADDKDVPRVTGIQHMNAREDTFCVTERLHNAAVFNNQITGNCAEIVEYSSPDETPVCVLASIGVDEFYEAGAAYDFERLHATTKLAVRNLDNVIDKMRYIEPQMERSNMKRRPIGVGMMGFASLLQKMRLPWFDPSNPRQPHPLTRQLNARIAECMYHAQIEATVELAEERGQHPSFSETKSAAGMLQFDLALLRGDDPPRFYDDWEELRERMLVSGRRNDQLGAFMPTAATALVRSKSEGIDPIQSNVFKRTTLTGEFVEVNRILVSVLIKEGLWNPLTRDNMVANNGSVRGIGLPQWVENVFATAWEIPQAVIIKLASDRQRYCEQAQSMNLHFEDVTPAKTQKALFMAWKEGCKTGCYYMRSRPAVDGVGVTTAAQQNGPACGVSGGCST
jgi:ribonucleotide reductase alpha subunit